MGTLMNREIVRWGVPAAVLLIVFVLYAGVASIVLVASGGPEQMAVAAADDPFDDVDESDADGGGSGTENDTDTSEPGTDTETPDEEPAAAPGSDPLLPSSCESLFSSTVVSAANSAGLVLNPSWADGTSPGGLTLSDPTLASALANASPSLDCRWLSPNGGSGVGIRSVIAVVTRDQALDLDTRFAALGYTAVDELGGTRYYFESTSGGERYGESHLVRGGLWFATHWLGYGPKGYTADMVVNHFG